MELARGKKWGVEALSDGVVKDSVSAVIVGIRAANDADDGEVLAVGACDGVEDAEAADGEGDDDAGADTAGAGETVGGVAGVELVATADEVEPRLGDEVVKERQVEVAGTEKTSVAPIWTSRRARWRPRVDSAELSAVDAGELWSVETTSLCGMLPTSLHGGLHTSSAPILVSIAIMMRAFRKTVDGSLDHDWYFHQSIGAITGTWKKRDA
ncbi:thiamine pyrophosphate dependent pyruvate decarboxylase family protein [Actinidia rufa]|uniref:Thiamine pyrophosphate dependent pyruvate decarboxylase family protein n=1 Tax=Actinidia rufa TaxID=165716 RepID=A0A7J0E8C1_9ERIC|nr:thiamine pyrophosphate dependent pyruvate decarboxylase family protein [Actinidia rufa]